MFSRLAPPGSDSSLLQVTTHLIALVFALACAPLWPVIAVLGLRRFCPDLHRLLCKCPPCSVFNSLGELDLLARSRVIFIAGAEDFKVLVPSRLLKPLGIQKYDGVRDTCMFRRRGSSNARSSHPLTPFLPLALPLRVSVLCAVRRAKRARLDAHLRREETLQRLRTCPRESKWRERGWLVILRARHQAFLIQQQPPGGSRPRVRLRVCRRPGRCPRVRFRLMGDPLETKRGSRGMADVDACEEGRSDREFQRIVVSVVDMREEGLFRGIVMYL